MTEAAPRPAGETVPVGAPARETWREALFNRRMLICVFTGFSSGLPLWLLINLVPAWLRTEGVDLKSIGLFALIGLPYTWKFLWAPLLDRYSLPLGRRRGWMLVTHIALIASIVALGQLRPQTDIWTIAYLAAVVAFFSASLDVAIDAFRREILPDQELGLGNSIHVNAYRIASLIPGSLALILADHLPWPTVFTITALFMLPGLAMTLVVREPDRARPPRTLRDAVVLPFREFIERSGWRHALLIVAFIFLYKLGDSMATALATPFYLDMGFTKTEIGVVAKNAGLWASVGRRPAGRPVDGQDGHQPRAVGVRRRPDGLDAGLRLAGLPRAARRGGAGRGDRLRRAGHRPRHRRLRSLHRPGDRPAVHRHPAGPVHQPVGGAADLCQRHDRLDRRAGRLDRLLPALHGARAAWNGITLACGSLERTSAVEEARP